MPAQAVEVAEAAAVVEEAEEAGTQTTEVQGRSLSSSDYTHSERGDNDYKGRDKWADKHDGDREYKKDRFYDDDKQGQGSFKDSGYKGKAFDDDQDFKGKPYPRKEYNDPLESPANPIERSGIIRTRGGGGSIILTRCETWFQYQWF